MQKSCDEHVQHVIGFWISIFLSIPLYLKQIQLDLIEMYNILNKTYFFQIILLLTLRMAAKGIDKQT